MASTPAEEAFDLLILVDATSSMTRFLASLRESLPQILSISGLTNCFERIGVLAYRDYCDQKLLEWSGWRGHTVPGKAQPDLVAIASKLEAIGGGDYPEAVKTGLAKAYQVMREDAKTLILFYADAPPHMHAHLDNGYSHIIKEANNLRNTAKYDGLGVNFVDWVSAAKTLRDGKKKAQFIGILSSTCVGLSVFEYMAAMTGGACIVLKSKVPRDISKLSVEVLLAWMGVHKPGAASNRLNAELLRYVDTSGLTEVENEQDKKAKKFFSVEDDSFSSQIFRIDLSSIALQQHLPKKPTPMQDFAKTYKESQAYRAVVVKHLREIIDRDVTAISLNPVFGSLWRVFCNDRAHPERQALIELFGRRVDDIVNVDERQRMKDWLEESYDYTAEVLGLIEHVDEAHRFPCVCLDPTLAFETAQDDEHESNKPITQFRRDELLEIGRSCDFRILRRLGRILTRLTFIDSAETMPSHIAATTEAEVPKIPLILASSSYQREFWRILLHIVVPGTMLSARSAALLAALSIKLGVRPLHEAATQEMILWKTRWNNIEVPETWNSSCLRLLLDADSAYRKDTEASIMNDAGLLLPKDRLLFQTFVDYKLLEANLNTELTAQVGWTPEKTTLPIGPLVTCRSCKLPRSVTVMGPSKTCGICLSSYDNKDHEENFKVARVTSSDNESTDAYWYECSVQSCRAQYVVYNVHLLNVRPKCHYCRVGQNAPFIECSDCLSRMIWPEEYRGDVAHSDWSCIACRSSRATVVNVDTTANGLRSENGDDWLVENLQNKIPHPFNGRSLFHVASAASPLSNFTDCVHILPGRNGQAHVQLHIRGKLVRNPTDLFDQLYSWVARRQTEQGTCSLCFSDFRKSDLVAACGRSGCNQRVCQTCANDWYGLNARGKILNVAATCCPFCRRSPTNKILMRYGMGVNTVGDLREAVANKGEWYYAWCAQCDHARQYVERVCARGPPPEIQDWTCDGCREARARRAGVSTGESTKLCPNCGIPTQKESGCDHITCTVPGCGAHWCFFCGESQDANQIYRHMESHCQFGVEGEFPYDSD